MNYFLLFDYDFLRVLESRCPNYPERMTFNFSLLQENSAESRNALVTNSCALESDVFLRSCPFRSEHWTEQPHMFKLPLPQGKDKLLYSPFESCPGPVIMSGSELLDIHPYGRARVFATISHKTTP